MQLSNNYGRFLEEVTVEKKICESVGEEGVSFL